MISTCLHTRCGASRLWRDGCLLSFGQLRPERHTPKSLNPSRQRLTFNPSLGLWFTIQAKSGTSSAFPMKWLNATSLIRAVHFCCFSKTKNETKRLHETSSIPRFMPGVRKRETNMSFVLQIINEGNEKEFLKHCYRQGL